MDHVSSSESLTSPGISLLYPSKLSESFRMFNRTSLECFDCFELSVVYQKVRIAPDTCYNVVNRMDYV